MSGRGEPFMNLVFIGYRGTGKSSVAQEMGNRLSWPVISTDELICRRAGQTIPEIVALSGWDTFRARESLVVNEAAGGDQQIIDTGGGVILREENVQALKRNGALIWLKASVETIRKRISGDDERPSLTGSKTTIDEVEEVLRVRNPLYQKAADFQLYTDSQSISSLCDLIIEWLMGSGLAL
jgi:shikimate kinase